MAHGLPCKGEGEMDGARTAQANDVPPVKWEDDDVITCSLKTRLLGIYYSLFD